MEGLLRTHGVSGVERKSDHLLAWVPRIAKRKCV